MLKIICEFVCYVIIVLTSPMLMIVGFYFMGLTNYAVSIPNYRLGILLVIMGFVGTIFWGRAFADITNRSMKRWSYIWSGLFKARFFFFANYSFPIIGRKEELKMKEFLVKLVKFFIILAILGPVISIIMVGIGLGALLF